MTNRFGFLVLLAFGLVIVRVGSSARLVEYVRVSSRPYVVAAGVLVAIVGLTLWVSPRPAALAPPAAAWLLLVPIAALVGVAPPTDGALAGHRRQGAPAPVAGTAVALGGAEPITIPLAEIVQRASWAVGSLRGHHLRVLGFIAGRRDGAVLLGRLSITCCAADAQEDDIEVHGPAVTLTSYPRGQWLLVTGTFAGMSPQDRFVPVLAASSITVAAAPGNPYD